MKHSKQERRCGNMEMEFNIFLLWFSWANCLIIQDLIPLLQTEIIKGIAHKVIQFLGDRMRYVKRLMQCLANNKYSTNGRTISSLKNSFIIQWVWAIYHTLSLFENSQRESGFWGNLWSLLCIYLSLILCQLYDREPSLCVYVTEREREINVSFYFHSGINCSMVLFLLYLSIIINKDFLLY